MEKTQLPELIAHRGASGYAPENTISSVMMAKELGIKWVEFDVMLSACGEPVIIHDVKINRTTNGRGRVHQMTYDELSQFDAGSWFSSSYKDHKIPSLKAMINCLKDNGLRAVIELKPYPGQEQLTAKKTFDLILDVWPQGLEHIIFASFQIDALKAIRQCCDKQAIGYGIHRWHRNWLDDIKALGCVSVHVNHWILNQRRTKALKGTGAHLLSYTVNNPKRALKLFKWGIDGIFSDFPDRFGDFSY